MEFHVCVCVPVRALIPSVFLMKIMEIQSEKNKLRRTRSTFVCQFPIPNVVQILLNEEKRKKTSERYLNPPVVNGDIFRKRLVCQRKCSIRL